MNISDSTSNGNIAEIDKEIDAITEEIEKLQIKVVSDYLNRLMKYN